MIPRVYHTQYGFRAGRSTVEPVFVIRRLQEMFMAKQDHALHLIFIDWSKAFDKVDPDAIPMAMKKHGCSDEIIRAFSTV